MENDNRKINFNAGPAALPEVVMQQAAAAIMNYNNTGLSILSIPHRGKLFDEILEESKLLVKELCGLDDTYEVLWLQGGGRLQFCMVPMNFMHPHHTGGYIDSGFWANEAMDYGNYYGDIMMLSSSKEDNYNCLPEWPDMISDKLAYLHFTTNNTIYGTQWPGIPKTAVPLIADVSSDIFSRTMDYANCSLFYAVAQKNLGAAGVTLVVAKKNFLETAVDSLPPMHSYKEHAAKNSVLNTPPVFAIYTALLMLRWTKERSIAGIEKENTEKAALLYAEIDRNSLFTGTAKEADRSRMNVCFTAAGSEQEKEFIRVCGENNIINIEGHRAVGAFRVSLYNAISLADVQHLVSVMQQFETKYIS